MIDPKPQDDPGRRVVPLRPRRRPSPSPAEDGPIPDLRRYERGESEDESPRMTLNLIGFVFVAGLIAIGVWIFSTLAEVRNKQDCVLSGRRSCDAIAVPPLERY